MVYIVSMSYIKINYWLKFDAVNLYYLKDCIIMTSKKGGGGGRIFLGRLWLHCARLYKST